MRQQVLRVSGQPWQDTAGAFRAAVESGRLDLPAPGSGRTGERWSVLAELAEEDLSLARLGEGHADALAILAELNGPTPPDYSRWGVWAAHPPGPGVTASQAAGRWRLAGTKQYCSGARACTHALVTAKTPDGVRLFAVRTDELVPVPGSWTATGMAGSDTLDVHFPEVEGEPVGEPGDYVSRPGFTHGGLGVAACWYGGARGIGRTLLAAAAKRELGPHALAHLGTVDLRLSSAAAALAAAAAEVDADPGDAGRQGQGRSLRLRALVAEVCEDVMASVGRALGAGPLCHDEAHGRAVADLTVYVRQHHAEQDLAALGTLVAAHGASW